MNKSVSFCDIHTNREKSYLRNESKLFSEFEFKEKIKSKKFPYKKHRYRLYEYDYFVNRNLVLEPFKEKYDTFENRYLANERLELIVEMKLEYLSMDNENLLEEYESFFDHNFSSAEKITFKVLLSIIEKIKILRQII